MEAENRMIKEHLKIVNTDLSFKMSLKDDEIQAWQKKILFTQEKWNTVQGEYKQGMDQNAQLRMKHQMESEDFQSQIQRLQRLSWSW
jgi:hypothetical protein